MYRICEDLVKKTNKIFLQGQGHLILGQMYEEKSDFENAWNEYKFAESVFDNIFTVKEFDDLSSLYSRMSILAAKMKRVDLTHKYLKIHREHFGLSHVRTKEIILFLDQTSLTVPW